MNVILVAHTENFKDNKDQLSWLANEFKKIERKINKKIKISWMLEEDDTLPNFIEVRGKNRGDVISNGKEFFSNLAKDGHELGIHIHFTKNWKIDFSYDNQQRLIKNAKMKFKKSFGFNPISFVGGWWHSDLNTLKILKNEGFKIDASPMPLYNEVRRRWIWGKIPTFLSVETCNWEKFTNRTPFITKNKIIYVPNAVNPNTVKFSPQEFISLDLMDKNLENSIEIFKEFAKRDIKIMCIPFHPHSINNEKIQKIQEFFIECNKISKINFINLKEVIKNDKKN